MVAFLVEQVLGPVLATATSPPRVIDPACGDGRILAAAGQLIARRFGVDPAPYLTGVELDPTTAADTAARLGVRVICGDAREVIDDRGVHDVVLGNPPYLSPLVRPGVRRGRSALGGGPYADVAAEFLALSVRLVRPRGGRIGLVLPHSLLATRDAGPIRTAVAAAGALELCWWADELMFDAAVRTCILGLVTGAPPGPVRRFVGADFAPAPAIEPPHDSPTWSWLAADLAGVPGVDVDLTATLGTLAGVTADFRDQYYGLIGAVGDDRQGPALVTSGLIDPGRCAWGIRPTTFAKVRYAAPRVDLGALEPALVRWAQSRLVPKVLVASQTRIVEAAVDETGAWLGSVPVISVIPTERQRLWELGALLCSPVASAWLAGRHLGSGLSASTIRLSAANVAAIPVPTKRLEWMRAAEALRRGDLAGCGRSMLGAYGLDQRDDIWQWWTERLSGARARRG